ncbi:MAG: inorganic phosphate transporter [Ruminococcaceae bacterium]|nr:inorganic phosphate transporter [Oscillospiraceae bacterium]
MYLPNMAILDGGSDFGFSTRSLTPKKALALAAVSNFAGAIIMAIICPTVAKTLYSIADFGSNPRSAIISLSVALITVIFWATLAAARGLPTSESHALISSVCGSALASNTSINSIQINEWKSVLLGIAISTLPVMLFSLFIYKISTAIFKDQDRRSTMRYFMRVQRISAGISSFLHGAQDSQKFIGVYMLGLTFIEGNVSANTSDFSIPIIITVACASAMTFGTLIGGSRIIKKIGCDMTELDPLSSSAADTASSSFLGVCSFFGIPTATTHAKTCAIMGIGLCKKGGTNPKIAAEVFCAWFLTFPICGIVSFLLSLLANACFL